MTIDRLNTALRRFEDVGITTLDDARECVQFFSSIRAAILAESSQVRIARRGRGADGHEILQLLEEWRLATATSKADVVCALDLWLLRLSLEWNIDENCRSSGR